ncbi:MAG: hypothetical protein WAL22_14365 [Solirubrobacteraceae bacterium]
MKVGFYDADAPVLGTRCAGPLEADIAAALPSRTVSLNRLRHGNDTIDLPDSERFAAHGLAGTVHSTIALRLRRARQSSVSNGSSPTPLPPGVRHKLAVDVEYQITHVTGSAIAAVRSSPVAAACGPFDACGLQGLIEVEPGATSGGSAFLAAGPTDRPKRDLLAALGLTSRGDPSGSGVAGAGFASVRGKVTADLTQDGTPCRDQADLRQMAIRLRQRADRLEVSVSPAVSEAGDPLRTRCPGPDLGQRQLTRASVPLTVLRDRTFTVNLHGNALSNGPYRMTTRSTVRVTLHRAKVTTQIVP